MNLRHRSSGTVASLGLALALCCVLACGSPVTVDEGPTPVLVVAVDGLEWSVLLPLLADGELPTLARWIESGQAGLLDSMRPTKSPVIWTTIATGKAPAEHGIRDFIRREEGQPPSLYTRLDREVPALWNIASAAELDSLVVGWWMTHPVEPIRGVMVAQTNILPGEGGEGAGLWKGAPDLERPDQVHPPELLSDLAQVVQGVDEDLDRRLGEIFGDLDFSQAPLVERMWRASRWSVRADAVYVGILDRFLAREKADFDLAMVYLGGADVLGHRFWRYHRPADFDFPPATEDEARFGEVLEDYYRFLDTVLAEIDERTANRWNILLVSDHGMTAHNSDSRFDEQQQLGKLTSGHHFKAPAGVIVATGPSIRRGGGRRADTESPQIDDLPTLGGVYDVTPTVLSLLGLPTALDMKGQPMKGLFAAELLSRELPAPVASYVGSGPELAVSGDEASSEDERLEQLRDLGYID